MYTQRINSTKWYELINEAMQQYFHITEEEENRVKEVMSHLLKKRGIKYFVTVNDLEPGANFIIVSVSNLRGNNVFNFVYDYEKGVMKLCNTFARTPKYMHFNFTCEIPEEKILDTLLHICNVLDISYPLTPKGEMSIQDMKAFVVNALSYFDCKDCYGVESSEVYHPSDGNAIYMKLKRQDGSITNMKITVEEGTAPEEEY